MDFERFNLKFRQLLVLSLILCGGASCRTEVPQAHLTDVGGQSAGLAPKKDQDPGRPQILERVVVEPVLGASPEVERSWRVSVKSVGEVWCERRCSQFELVEQEKDGVISLGATKKVILGNTEPGVLDVSREFKTGRDRGQKLKIENVGAVGETVLLSPSDFGSESPNFYALPMTIVRRQAGSKNIILGRFDGGEIEVRFAPGCKSPGLSDQAHPQPIFVMGSLIGGKAPTASRYFIVRKAIFPWSEG